MHLSLQSYGTQRTTTLLEEKQLGELQRFLSFLSTPELNHSCEARFHNPPRVCKDAGANHSISPD